MKILPSKIDSYINNIKKENIIGCLVYGPNQTLANFRFSKIAKIIAPDINDAFSVVSLSKKQLEEDENILCDEFYANSFLQDRKLIMINDSIASIKNPLKQIIENYKINSDNNFVLIKAGDLDKSSSLRKIFEESEFLAAIACYDEEDYVIKSYIRELLNKNNLSYDDQIVQFIAENINNNRLIAEQEITKICNYLGEENKLTLEVVMDLCASERENGVNELIDSLIKKDNNKVINITENLLEQNFELVTIIRAILSYMQKLYFAKCDIEIKNVRLDSAIKAQAIFFKLEKDFRNHLNILSIKKIVKFIYQFENLELKIKKNYQLREIIFKSTLFDLVN